MKEIIHKRKFEAVILGWGLSRDPDPFDIWHSSKTKPGEFNFIGYKNAEVDRLIEAGRETFDRQERTKIYHRIHQLLYQDQPYVFLYIPDSLPILNRRFRNVEVTPLGISYNFIEWSVLPAERKYLRYRMES